MEINNTGLCLAKGSLQEKDGGETDNLDFSSKVEEDLKKSKLDSNFACKLGEKRSYDERNLKKHLQVKHKGVIYSCNECDFNATLKQSLRRHQQSKHEDNFTAHYLNNSETIGSSSHLGSEDAAASKAKDVDLSNIILAEEDVTEVILDFIEIDSNILKTEFLGSEDDVLIDLKQENNEYSEFKYNKPFKCKKYRKN